LKLLNNVIWFLRRVYENKHLFRRIGRLLREALERTMTTRNLGTLIIFASFLWDGFAVYGGWRPANQIGGDPMWIAMNALMSMLGVSLGLSLRLQTNPRRRVYFGSTYRSVGTSPRRK
jgi:hypothetical protein